MPVGFIGLGAMGEPMAMNLARSGQNLVVWNRTAAKAAPLVAMGARMMEEPADVIAACRTIFLMLSDGAAIDAVLSRAEPEWGERVAGRTIVNTATVSPDYSRALQSDIRAAGGRYVEAPVSGSRKPAEAGQLVAMVAGDTADVARIQPLLMTMCRAVAACGPVPGALAMKLAVNIFLITSMTGLAESANFARAQGLDLATWGAILNSSQMSSDISRVKVDKLLAGNLEAQAAIGNVLESNRLVVEAAGQAGIAVPLMDACLALYGRTETLGFGEMDMISVVHAFDRLSGSDT